MGNKTAFYALFSTLSQLRTLFSQPAARVLDWLGAVQGQGQETREMGGPRAKAGASLFFPHLFGYYFPF